MPAKQDTAEQGPWAEEHRLLAAIVHDSNDAITIQDFDGNFKLWNLGAELMYGYNKTEALKMNVSQIIPNHKVDEVLASTKKLSEGEEIRSFGKKACDEKSSWFSNIDNLSPFATIINTINSHFSQVLTMGM
jgi:PAS domain S-box-containing protein